MARVSKEQTGFSLAEAVIILGVVLLIAAAFLFILKHNKTTVAQTSSSTNTSSSNSNCQFKDAMGCHWYIGAPVLASIYKASPIIAKDYFDNPTTFFAVTDSSQLSQIPSGWKVTPIFTYFDETLMHSAVTGHSLPAAIKGVSLDDELAVCKVYGHNECTPAAEQGNPVPYEQDAAKISKANNLLYLDVGADPDPKNANNRWHAAAFASYVDSQIQLSQPDLTKYTQESNTYLTGWKLAPKVYTASNYSGVSGNTAQVIDGITVKVPTCPTGQTGCTTYQTAPASQMEAAVKATMNTGIWGYWLNCPSGSTPGPGPCSQDDVNSMVSFLESMQSVY